ncbi:MAG: tail fiber protein [Formivibrio sp.]|nr:tail fiber protein [Formivibrio sp.]
MDPIIGQIILWPINWVPDGWHLCDGSLLPVSQNQALFSLLGTYYGGDGRNTFGLPDLRNKVPLGAANVSAIAQVGGSASAAVTSIGQVVLNAANMPTHTHAATFSGTGGGPTAVSVNVAIPSVASTTATPAPVAVPGNTVNLSATAGPANKIYSAAASDSTLKPFQATGSITVPAPTGNVTVVAAGSATPTPVAVGVQGTAQTLPPYQTMNYIIALQGIYPSRP